MTDQQQLPSEGQQLPASDQTNNGFSIPESYSGKEWAKNIKGSDDLWSQLANAQSMIGKKSAPSADAPDAEWDAFYTASGRPETPDKYKFSDIEGLPEGVDLNQFKEKAAAILHSAGLNQRQADKVWKQYISSELSSANESKLGNETKQKELDTEFDALTKEHFGDKFEAASSVATEMLNASVPQAMRNAIAEAAPKTQVAMIAALSSARAEIDAVKKKYGAEGSMTSGGQTSSQSIEETRAELAGLRTSKAGKDFLNPDHKKTTARINELAGVVSNYYKNPA